MSRGGLKRLQCPDGCASLGGRPFAAYLTLAQLEHGMRPVCPGCMRPCLPEDPALWHLVPRDELERSEQYAELLRVQARVAHGQAPHIQRGRQVRSDLEVSGERVARAVQTAAAQRRRAGLRQFAAASAAASSIPF